jgi:hypothetical protein
VLVGILPILEIENGDSVDLKAYAYYAYIKEIFRPIENLIGKGLEINYTDGYICYYVPIISGIIVDYKE